MLKFSGSEEIDFLSVMHARNVNIAKQESLLTGWLSALAVRNEASEGSGVKPQFANEDTAVKMQKIGLCDSLLPEQSRKSLHLPVKLWLGELMCGQFKSVSYYALVCALIGSPSLLLLYVFCLAENLSCY
uniref:Uncharacterized protein n=1 Tax=Oryza rufipogon TaxID=4529 RepID=A0A0E0PDU0_ORYRU